MRIISLLILAAFLAACTHTPSAPTTQPAPTAAVQGPPAPTTQPTNEPRLSPAPRPGDQVREIDRPREVAVQLDCSDNVSVATIFVSVMGIGPRAADILGIGLLEKGNWSYIVSRDPCGDGSSEVHGWVEYPATDPMRVVFHMWAQTEPYDPTIHGAEQP